MITTEAKILILPKITVRPAAKGRIVALDALRGVAMVLMALDHAASFVRVSLQAETYGGQPAVLLGWPYWVSGLLTNLAAPIFWLLSGVSVALLEAGRRRDGASEWDITRFLLIRAGVILVLDLTVCQMAWAGQGPYLHVLLSIAVGLAILSVTRLLPLRLFTALTLTWLMGYQVWLPRIAAELSQTQNFWTALWLSYSTVTRPATEFSVLGWGSLMGLGFVLGRLITRPELRHSQVWGGIGAALLGGWAVLRWRGGFGDLTPFTGTAPWYYFLVMSKTPPSLTFLAFNLGSAAFLLAVFYALSTWLERSPGQWLVIIGQVSLFFFVLHIVVYNGVSRVVLPLNLPGPAVIRVYITWLSGIAVLLPLAWAYRYMRRRYPRSLLRYL